MVDLCRRPRLPADFPCQDSRLPLGEATNAEFLFPAGGPEFLKTPLGGNFLVYESFLYRREKGAGEKVYWTCREHAVHGCRSRAITQGQRVTVMRSHCHSPDIEGLQARRQQEKTIKKIQARRIGAGDLEDCDDIEDSLLQGVDSLFYRRGQGTLTLSRSKSKSKSRQAQCSSLYHPESKGAVCCFVQRQGMKKESLLRQ